MEKNTKEYALNITDILFEHPDYQAMKWRWKKMRLILAGEDAVKEWDAEHSKGARGKETFILCPPGQEAEDYKFFVYSAPFFNITARTGDVLLGFAFYRDPMVKVPEGLESLIDNFDLAGTTLAEFSKRVFLEVLTMGRGALALDYPTVREGEEITLLEAEEANARPFAKFYEAEQVYNWEYSLINNARVLTKIFIDESYEKGFYEKRSLIRILELERNSDTGRWQYRNTLIQRAPNAEIRGFGNIQNRFMGGKSKVYGQVLSSTVPQTVGGEVFETLPFWFVGPMFDQYNIQKAPLSDIGDLNIEHYRKSAQISSALFHCAHPTPILCGFTFQKNEELVLGSRKGVTTSNADAHAAYLELNGQSITEIRKERDAVTLEIVSLGGRLVMNTSQSNETAETSRIKASGDTSVMNTMSSTFDQVFTLCLNTAAKWQGIKDSSISVSFCKEFMPYRLNANDMNALLAAVASDKMAMEDYVEIMQTGGVIRQSRQFGDYIAAIKAQVAEKEKKLAKEMEEAKKLAEATTTSTAEKTESVAQQKAGVTSV